MEAGETFGKYLLVRRLATGGMADIYLARQSGVEGFQKPCVIKRILPQLAADAQFVSMFLDEARIAALLSHPNVVQIFDLGKVAGSYYLAMEHIHGEDLGRILEAEKARGRRTLPTPIAVRILAQVAEGLAYAHTACDEDGHPLGIVHRDVSPGNVIVAYSGSVKLVDFGIAKAAVKHTQTEVGVIKGKVPYMSPEQVQGLELDARSDIFSMGVILYELTTGEKPFPGDNVAQLCMQIVGQTPVAPSELVPGYPDALADIVRRALGKTPAERFSSAGEMHLALEAFLASRHEAASTQHVANYLRELFPQASARTAVPGAPAKTPVARTPMAFEETVTLGSGPKRPHEGSAAAETGARELTMRGEGDIALAQSMRNLGARSGPRSLVLVLAVVAVGGYFFWTQGGATWLRRLFGGAAIASAPADAGAQPGVPAQRHPAADASPIGLDGGSDARPHRRRPIEPGRPRPLTEPTAHEPPPAEAQPTKPEAHLPTEEPAPAATAPAPVPAPAAPTPAAPAPAPPAPAPAPSSPSPSPAPPATSPAPAPAPPAAPAPPPSATAPSDDKKAP